MKTPNIKSYWVIYRSKTYPSEGNRRLMVRAESKKQIHDNWHAIMNTDDYVIQKIEEVPRNDK